MLFKINVNMNTKPTIFPISHTFPLETLTFISDEMIIFFLCEGNDIFCPMKSEVSDETSEKKF